MIQTSGDIPRMAKLAWQMGDEHNENESYEIKGIQQNILNFDWKGSSTFKMNSIKDEH